LGRDCASAFGQSSRARGSVFAVPITCPARGVAGLAAACGCAFVIGLASCGGSSAGTSGGSTSGGAGGSATTTGASGGDDLLGGSGGMQATCTSAGGTTTSSGGAGGAGGANGAPTGCEGVGGGAHFAKDVGPILAGCTGELCHLPPGRADLVGVLATECCDGRLLVAPFDAAHSYVLDKVNGTNLCYGGRMPFDAPPLGGADTDAIVRWICAGALDD
jgi:hypothetical protein